MDQWLHRILIISLLTLPAILAPSAEAKRSYGRAGCGLGSIVMGPNGNQIFAFTTNGTGVQTFGITTGTSNCSPTGRNYQVAQQEDFISNNLATISKEIARGEGETLTTLSSLLGCPTDQAPAVARELKDSYNSIFAAPGAIAVLDACKDVILENQSLAQSCLYLN